MYVGVVVWAKNIRIKIPKIERTRNIFSSFIWILLDGMWFSSPATENPLQRPHSFLVRPRGYKLFCLEFYYVFVFKDML